jgi:hypothetical protein
LVFFFLFGRVGEWEDGLVVWGLRRDLIEMTRAIMLARALFLAIRKEKECRKWFVIEFVYS